MAQSITLNDWHFASFAANCFHIHCLIWGLERLNLSHEYPRKMKTSVLGARDWLTHQSLWWASLWCWKTSFPRFLCGSEHSGKDLGTAIQMHNYEIWVAERERGRLQGIHCSVSDCDKSSRILEPAVMVATSCFVEQFSSSAASC